jgi:hypothetical protein
MADSDVSNGISLLDALVQWSDPDLVETVRACERHHTLTEMSSFTGPRLVPDTELREPLEKEWMLGGPNYMPIAAAWRRLYADFVQRLTREEFHLSGVQTRPVLTTVRRPIPGVWAAECEFDFTKSVVTIREVRFTAVIASRTAPATPADAPTEPTAARPLEGTTPVGAEGEGGDADAPVSTRRGRDSFRPIIEQAVRDHWHDVHKLVTQPSGAEPNWSGIARMLHKRLTQQKSRFPELKVPQFETLRTRLPKIYSQVLIEKGVRN